MQAPPTESQLTLRLAVYVDVSGSAQDGYEFEDRHAAALTGLVRQFGGEVGFGLIGDGAPNSLIRFAAELAPSLSNNLLLRARQQPDQVRDDALVKTRADSFIVQVMEQYRSAGLARRTDIGSALSQGQAFLFEPLAKAMPVRRVLLLLTDGDQTGATPLPTLTNDVETLVVHASGRVHTDLEQFNPLVFGSTEAVLAYLRDSLQPRDAQDPRRALEPNANY